MGRSPTTSGGDQLARSKGSAFQVKEQQGRRPWNEITIEPEELEGYCDAYFQKCKETDEQPTKPGLAVYIGISVDTYNRWVKNEDGRHSKHAAVLKKSEAIMSDLLQQRKDSMALFLLKQPCYGGYSDQQQVQATGTLHFKVTFGGKPPKSN